MNYTIRLDKTTLSDVELDQLFQELKDAADALFPPKLFDKMAVDRRSISHPLSVALMSEPGRLVEGAISAGWYPITNTVLKHISSSSEAENLDGTHYPVVEVSGAVGFVGACAGGGTPAHVCIGVSVDGGVTWNPLDGSTGDVNTSRALGSGCGKSLAYYDSPDQSHYIYATPNYFPIDYQSDKLVQVVASFGGNHSSALNPAALTAYCLMIDGQQTDICQGWGWLELNAREGGY